MIIRTLSAFLSLLFLSSCASTSLREFGDSSEILEQVCSKQENVKEVFGSVWMQVEADPQKGRFPATLLVRPPHSLQMEVTNLIGGTVARIQIRDGSYQIEIPGEGRVQRGTDGYWSGIPLHWAVDVFLGQLPCPDGEKKALWRVRFIEEDRVEVQYEDEFFEYELKPYAGRIQAESLLWKKGSEQVEWKFQDPERGTGVSLRWEVSSSHGSARVRWRDRKVEYFD
jgi:hypothetical protein